MLQDRFKMLVFVRPRLSPYSGFLQFSPLYSLPYLIQMHICLECLDVSLAGMLDTHPLLLFYLCFLYTVAAIRRWSLGVQEQKIPGACLVVETPEGQE